MQVEGHDEFLVLIEALASQMETHRLKIAESPIPVPGTLGEAVYQSRMKALSICTELYQRACIHYDRIKMQTQPKNDH